MILFLCLYGVARGQTNLDYRYWFDGDVAASRQGFSDSKTWDMQVDVSELTDGIHFLNFQVIAADTLFSPVSTATFIKSDSRALPCVVSCFINDSLWAETQLQNSGGIVGWNLDVTRLSEDEVHTLLMFLKSANGIVSSIKQTYFLRVKTQDELALACYYSLDDGRTVHEAGRFEGQGFCFDIDIDSLTSGLHQLSCFIVDERGYVLQSRTYNFFKPEDMHLCYDYWLNDDIANMRSVSVKAIQPYHFINKLDVGAQPIKPCDFHFEFDEGEPYVYGKNELHVRFSNRSGAFVTDSCVYIDGASRQLVEPRANLRPKFSHTDETPALDAIYWYTLPAMAGDSVSLKLSQDATLALYSPTGVKLLDTSEGVVEGVGLSVPEDGIYYLALHSVTGKDRQTTIELNNSNLTGVKVQTVKTHVDVYTLDGVRLRSQVPVNQLMNELPRGIYIVDGRKMLIK